MSNETEKPAGIIASGFNKPTAVNQTFKPAMSSEALRKMDHVDWLENFAHMMQMQTGVRMTPMRQGVISRLQLAAQFVTLLKADGKALVDKIKVLEKEIERLRKLKGVTPDDGYDCTEGR